MRLNWSDRYRDLIGGLDLLGVRQLDQGLEVQLVGGFTTVAPRARYLALLPWALATYYRRRLDEGGGQIEIREQSLDETLTRLEFLVAAATQSGARASEGGTSSGAVGGEVYRAALAGLEDGDEVEFPRSRRPGVLNAYGAPIQALGLLTQTEEGGPLALTPRGSSLVSKMDMPREAARALLDEQRLSPQSLEAIRAAISLNGLKAAPAERGALLEALDTPAGSGAAVRVDQFRATRVWAIRLLQSRPDSGDGLIDRAYLGLIATGAGSAIAAAWGEVALRKRVHFALELMLAALANSLPKDRGASISQVLRGLNEDLGEAAVPGALATALGHAGVDLDAPWASFCDRIPDDAFLAQAPSRNHGRVPPTWQCSLALALLAVTERQSRAARARGHVRDRGAHAMEQTFALIAAGKGSVSDVAESVLKQVVAPRHLRHTLRKMAQQQANSLRFFPRGPALVPTGTVTRAGFSLTRLNSVLQVMADLGHLDVEKGVFRPTDEGIAWAREVER